MEEKHTISGRGGPSQTLLPNTLACQRLYIQNSEQYFDKRSSTQAWNRGSRSS